MTNKSIDGRAPWAFTCGRGVHEKVYGELKSGFAVGSVPSNSFHLSLMSERSCFASLSLLCHSASLPALLAEFASDGPLRFGIGECRF